MPKLEQFEIKKYWQIFSGLSPSDNKVTHDQVAPILHNSKLEAGVLGKIWFLSDIDGDGNLDFEEFVICMRLIFDMVNQNITAVPDELPDWLVPGSKVELVRQRASQGGVAAASAAPASAGEAPEMEWYMSPEDRALYERLYQKCQTATDGSVGYQGVKPVVTEHFQKITQPELEQVWALVNPKGFAAIDRDPVMYLFHLLRQRSDVGAKIPAGVPASLGETFAKERVTTDIANEGQGAIRKSELHIASASRSNSARPKNENSDYSATAGTDWEVVQLQRELAALDSQLSDLKQQQESAPPTRAEVLREQFEGLLKFKQAQLSTSTNSSPAMNVLSLTEDIDSLEEQVTVLQHYLSTRSETLQQLQWEIQSLK
ncbi:AER416Cp [Eremothecium gossypii ATCC 10895]|uniref:Actin cytoskeleton-regulatory complex protein END3 n=1 Tax=Eremothecium gossypii (strain ATCC 10895 / CBS 109.51 / FGSC 9923 / NRRL Y-1056) TaxID=284811 RepID=END3_EREGS|nr:AER416Cp [Eremothecium gossypii ATCC 10895]Q755V2.2 RecName: Full=Actin cytoskeleton-regulatory complex protein END3; AltName: Full=Endocytosis protein 3 [Eremothecium gossypii ATCC 10895]AAS53095.2 AER416Cp [Eremothecium gossypii ATCC 10895]